MNYIDVHGAMDFLKYAVDMLYIVIFLLYIGDSFFTRYQMYYTRWKKKSTKSRYQMYYIHWCYQKYSLLHLEWHLITFSNLILIGFFSTERGKRDVEN